MVLEHADQFVRKAVGAMGRGVTSATSAPITAHPRSRVRPFLDKLPGRGGKSDDD